MAEDKKEKNPHYRMIGKNCADIVGRVLIEGGSETYQRYVKKNVRPGLFTTPRDIAAMLNHLVKKVGEKKLYHLRAQNEVVVLFMYS